MSHGESKANTSHVVQTQDKLSPLQYVKYLSSTAFLLIVVLSVFGFSLSWILLNFDPSSISGLIWRSADHASPAYAMKQTPCSGGNSEKKVCHDGHQSARKNLIHSSATECPEYFRWIYEDLKPWRTSGVSRETMERGKEHAHFRLVIVKGKPYLEKFRHSFQTRDLFTIWGFVQLLRFYPGMVPDVELLFRCGDTPVIKKHDYQQLNASQPPAMFQYCGSDDAIAVVFPDWSFWGWAELNIRPWRGIVERIVERSKEITWEKREPQAFWKGNPESPDRRDLMSCNGSMEHDHGVRLYRQNWREELKEGLKHSHLEDQCTHRYKIYIEGWGWSVSEKYILACDSMTLFVKNKYYDFFTRGLMPLKHFWPIRRENKCRDLKFAVQWGNKHPSKARQIGTAGSQYIREEVKIENVYAYMLYLLMEYAKLLRFKPEIPKNAVELSAEGMAGGEGEARRRFMAESMVRSPSDGAPCAMPPPYDRGALDAIFKQKERVLRKVETWTDHSKYI